MSTQDHPLQPLVDHYVNVARELADALLPVIETVADNLSAFIGRLAQALEPFHADREAIEHHGITEADIHSYSNATGIVSLHNRRWVNTRTGETGWNWKRT